MPDITPIPKPLLESTRLVIVVGASYPSMRPPNPPYIQPIPAPRGEERKEGQWFHIIPSPPPEEGFPHAKHFCVRHQIMVGTVDEIVAQFRDQLIKSFHQLHQTADLPEDASDNQREDQASMWEATAMMQNVLNPAFNGTENGRAVSLPWIDRSHPAVKDWENAKMVNMIKVKRAQAKSFNQELLAKLKSPDHSQRKDAVDQIHAFLAVTVHDAKLKLADSGVHEVTTTPICIRMWGITIDEKDFEKEVDVRDQWKAKLGIGQAGHQPNPADLYLIDVDTE